MKNKKGFTIVELVIVIAVIAILAAVLIPTFTTVTANARASAALSQAKNAQSSVLGNTEGVMPENTLFAINSTGNADYDYAFVIKERKIEQVKNESLATAEYPASQTINVGTTETPDNRKVYTVFVTADRFGEKASTAATKVDGLVASVIAYDIGGKNASGVWETLVETNLPEELKGVTAASTVSGNVNGVPQGSNFAVWQIKVGETTAYAKVYYNGDIADTCVCFMAA